MALDKLGGSETGATAKAKINLAFDEVDNNLADIAAAFQQIDLNASVEYVNQNVIQDLSGTPAPDDALGKEGDRYHRYSTVAGGTTLVDSTSPSDYVNTSFALFRDLNALPGQVSHINVGSGDKGFILWEESRPLAGGLSMSFKGGLARPITITSETATSIGFTLDATSQAEIAGMLTGDAMTLEESGVLSGKDEEYVKIHDLLGGVSWRRLLPATPPAQGEYKLSVDANGNPSWVTI